MNIRLTARRQRAFSRFTIMSNMDWLVATGHIRRGSEESLGAILASAQFQPDYQRYVNRKAREQQKLVWHEHFKFLTETAKRKKLDTAHNGEQ